MYCKNCGKEIDNKAVICIHCGCITGISIQEKSWLVALLLCFFLGGIGAHRFYTGHIGSGIAQLILTFSIIGVVISAPWALIDFICILCNNFKTVNGEDLKK